MWIISQVTRTRREEALFALIHPKGGEKGLLVFCSCCRDGKRSLQEPSAFTFFTPTAEGGELQIKSAFVLHTFVLRLWS